MSALEGRIAELEAEVARLTERKSRWANACRELENRAWAAEAEVGRQKLKIESRAECLRMAQERIADLEAEVERLNATRAKAEARIARRIEGLLISPFVKPEARNALRTVIDLIRNPREFWYDAASNEVRKRGVQEP